jgi:hypothetical protein
MCLVTLFRTSRPLLALGVLLSCFLAVGHNRATTWGFDPRAHIERGDRVEERYKEYGKRLSKHHVALVAAVKKNVPELLGSLQPRGPILYGYQILPLILPRIAAEAPARTSPTAYSWPWTDRLIDLASVKLRASASELGRAAKAAPDKRRVILQRLVRSYQEQTRRMQNIHAHIQYNRFWQGAIARDRARYAHETALYLTVLERQAIVERATRGGARELARARPAAFDPSLARRAALLNQRIDRSVDHVMVPSFVELRRVNNEFIFSVPLITDIAEHAYVNAVKDTIETIWRLSDGAQHYRVKLELTHITPAALYGGKEPASGENIDLERHLARFPAGRAILTTGARTTHVERQAIILGPHAIAPRVLAHEFGHILGFRDRYARGYQDLGKDGFQVMEAMIDEADIMGGSGSGRGAVHRRHFLELLKHFKPRLESRVESLPRDEVAHLTRGGSSARATRLRLVV